MVITKPEVFGRPVSSDLSTLAHKKGALTYAAFGLEARQLEVTRISPHPTEAGRVLDMVGVVTTLEGEPLPAGDIASRLGGFKDMKRWRRSTAPHGRATHRDHSGQPE
jgi:hypothetical protein